MSRNNMFEGSEASKSLLGDFSDHNESDDEGGDHKIRKTQSQVNEVIDIMRNNMNKVLDREGKLDDLEGKSEMLADGAIAFRKRSRKMTWDMWLQNARFKIIVVLAILAILAIILIPYFMKKKKE